MHKYRLVAKKGEGTFSEVLKAQAIKNGKHVAIKCMKSHFSSLEQVNSLREVQALRRLSPHPNIIKLLEALYDAATGRLALVFELMEMNLYELIRGRTQYLPEERIRKYMYQLLKAIDHMHRNGVFHRDIKPENILITDDQLKVADFGSCRGIYSKPPFTEYISTRWYRAPEGLLTDGYYNHKMDTWGVGCVFFEIASLFPLFPGTNEVDQLDKIHTILGNPRPEVLAKMRSKAPHAAMDFPHRDGTGIGKLAPHLSADAVDLITQLLTYDADERPSARQALRHPYFADLREEEKRIKLLAAHDLGVSAALLQRSVAQAPMSARLRALPPEIRGPKLNDMLACMGAESCMQHADEREERDAGGFLAELAQAGVSLAQDTLVAQLQHFHGAGACELLGACNPCAISIEADARQGDVSTSAPLFPSAHAGGMRAAHQPASHSTSTSQALLYGLGALKPHPSHGDPHPRHPPAHPAAQPSAVASASAMLLAKVRQTLGAGGRGLTVARTRASAVQQRVPTYRGGVAGATATRKYVSPYSQRVLAQARAAVTTGPE